MSALRPTLSAALLLPVLAAAQGSRPAPHPVLDRVVTLGASLTDGFGSGVPLARYLEASIRVPHRRVERASSALFFLRPLAEGKRQVDRALHLKATLVVGADFLFWYGYGNLAGRRRQAGGRVEVGGKKGIGRELAVRGWFLERGLDELGRLGCRLAVGDLPDMTGADARMLRPSQIPSAAARRALNRRIHAWAAKRPDVLVLPLARWVADMKAGRMRVPGRGPGQPPVRVAAEKILGPDRLHPSKLGAIVFHRVLVDALRRWVGKAAAGALDFDLWAVLEAKGLARELRGAGTGR